MFRKMNKWLILSLVILCIFKINLSRAEDDEEDEERPRSCAKYILDFVMGIAKSMLKCLGGNAGLKFNGLTEYVTRAGCLLKCTLTQEGTLTEEGLLDDIGAAFYFEETFDTPVRETALPLVQSCFAMADQFNPKEYWCKSYIPFIECTFGAILKGLIPYGGDCVTNPILGIFFSALKYLAPNSPSLTEDMEELRRAVASKNQIKCFDKNCTRLYEYKKVNGSNSIVVYNKDMQVLSVEGSRKKKPKFSADGA